MHSAVLCIVVYIIKYHKIIQDTEILNQNSRFFHAKILHFFAKIA